MEKLVSPAKEATVRDAQVRAIFRRRIDPTSQQRDLAVIRFGDSSTIAMYQIDRHNRVLDLFETPEGMSPLLAEDQVQQRITFYANLSSESGLQFTSPTFHFPTRQSFAEVVESALDETNPAKDSRGDEGNTNFIHSTIRYLVHQYHPPTKHR